MPKEMPSRERLEELVALAQSYRDLGRREIAQRLGRDAHNLIPETGNPKLDLVVKLAQLLDWPVDMVVSELYSHGRGQSPDDLTAATARERNREAWKLMHAERWDDATALLRGTLEGVAPDEAKAYAAQLLVTALESRGRYLEALEVARTGLSLARVGSVEALRLRALLAYCHYVIGALYEAEGLATALIDSLRDIERGDPLRQTLGFALSVRGHSRRVLCAGGVEAAAQLAAPASEDLARAIAVLEDHEARGTVPADRGLAEIARGGLVELDVLTGALSVEEAIGRVMARLEGTEDLSALDSTAAEALGWWCLCGANIVLRHVADEATAQSHLAILTTKADEVACRLGHWALHERVFTIDHLSQARSAADLAQRGELLEPDELRVLTGTMARFPLFRHVGWQILRARTPSLRGETP